MSDQKNNVYRNPAREAQPARRVGVLSLGLGLAAAGALTLAEALLPGMKGTLLPWLCPLVLLCLGGEVLWYGTHQQGLRLKYDGVSMVLCAALAATALAAWLVPPARAAEARRQEAAAQAELRLADELAPLLEGTGTVEVRCRLQLPADADAAALTADTLAPGQLAGVEVWLQGPCGSRTDFVMGAAAVRDRLAQLPQPPESLCIVSSSPAAGSYRMELTDPGFWSYTPEELERCVQRQAPEQEAN